LWQPRNQAAPVPLPGSHDFVDFTSDSQFLVTWNGKTYKFWDVATVEERSLPMEIKGHIDGVHLLEGQIVVSEYFWRSGWLVDDCWIKLWMLNPKLTILSEPIVLPLNISGPISFSPDGRRLTAWHMVWNPNEIKLFEARTGRELAWFPSSFTGGAVPAQEFSPDGSRLLTDDQTIWDITIMPPRRLGSVDGQTVTFSTDGEWVAVGKWEETLRASRTWNIFHVANLEKSSIWHTESEDEPRFAADSRTFAAKIEALPSSFSEFLAKWLPVKPASYSETVKVWQLPGGEEIASCDGDSFAYFPDGKRLAVARQGIIDLWDIPPHRPWWIDYGLPVLFVLLLMLTCWHCIRFRRNAHIRPDALKS
jgi:WD40 repeat protein